MGAEVLEGFTEIRAEPGETVDGDLEKEGPPEPGETWEQKHRGTKGRLDQGMAWIWVAGGQGTCGGK